MMYMYMYHNVDHYYMNIYVCIIVTGLRNILTTQVYNM